MRARIARDHESDDAAAEVADAVEEDDRGPTHQRLHNTPNPPKLAAAAAGAQTSLAAAAAGAQTSLAAAAAGAQR
ncbi:MAG: hypothetical protein GC172_03435 [Phycisphaera sp.]|nr:hypothetical protein [Phycisphaera sp.]